MEYGKLVQLVGQDWADFLKPFMTPDEKGVCPYDAIAGELKPMFQNGKKVEPGMMQVFRAFQETPLDKVRVIVLGPEPFPVEGYSNGLAFSTDKTQLPASITELLKGVERDAYNKLDFTHPHRTGTLGRPQEDGTVRTWTSQGVLLLNCALTCELGIVGAHLALWRPFIDYIVSNIWKVKRNLIFLAWGDHPKDVCHYRGGDIAGQGGTGVNIFNAFMLESEHPADAARAKRPWITDNFGRTNLIIKCNGLGEPIEW